MVLERTGGEGLVLHHFDHVGDLGDHPAHGGGVLQGRDAAGAVEAQADHGGALILLAKDRAAGLTNGDVCHRVYPSTSAVGVEAPSARRPITSETFLPRLAATWRGED